VLVVTIQGERTDPFFIDRLFSRRNYIAHSASSKRTTTKAGGDQHIVKSRHHHDSHESQVEGGNDNDHNGLMSLHSHDTNGIYIRENHASGKCF